MTGQTPYDWFPISVAFVTRVMIVLATIACFVRPPHRILHPSLGAPTEMYSVLYMQEEVIPARMAT